MHSLGFHSLGFHSLGFHSFIINEFINVYYNPKLLLYLNIIKCVMLSKFALEKNKIITICRFYKN